MQVGGGFSRELFGYGWIKGRSPTPFFKGAEVSSFSRFPIPGFQKLAAEAAPTEAQAASGSPAADARRAGQSMKPIVTAASSQQ